ncbi:MAG: helix-turn-helix domain-containing protein [Bdellovibrio sp.]|nr:helix-turn-helix domain-containing protein [Methylotenera sp.]
MANNENTKNKGVAASTATPKTKTTKYNFKDNSSTNQCLKMRDWLIEKGNITTTQAREHLDVMSPAARILQLKKAGYLIIKINDTWTSEHGINHKGVARYVLTQIQPVEAINNSEVAA